MERARLDQVAFVRLSRVGAHLLWAQNRLMKWKGRLSFQGPASPSKSLKRVLNL